MWKFEWKHAPLVVVAVLLLLATVSLIDESADEGPETTAASTGEINEDMVSALRKHAIFAKAELQHWRRKLGGAVEKWEDDEHLGKVLVDLESKSMTAELRAMQEESEQAKAKAKEQEEQDRKRAQLEKAKRFKRKLASLTPLQYYVWRVLRGLLAGHAILNSGKHSKLVLLATALLGAPEGVCAATAFERAGTPSAEESPQLRILNDASSEFSDSLMESLSRGDTATSATEPAVKQLLARMEEMEKEQAETKNQLTSQKKQLDEEQKKHAEKIATLESMQHKLTQYEAKDAEQVKMLAGCLKPQRKEEAKLESEIATLGAETKATEAKLSAAEMQRQQERSAAVHAGVGEDGGQQEVQNHQAWVHRRHHSRCEAASCCSAKAAFAQCLVTPEVLGGGFGTVNMHESPDAEYLEKRLKRLEEQANGCPYDLKPEDDASSCKEYHCDNSDALANRLRCRWTCNPNCNPAVPQVSYTTATYIPAATIASGHRHCDDKYTVMAQEKNSYKGVPLNRHKKVPIRVAVCGKCISNEYSLHPAYASDGKILGVCRPLVEHDLYLEMDKTCGNDGKNDDGSYCSGDPMPLKCQEFVKEWGAMQDASMPNRFSFNGFVDGAKVGLNGLNDHSIEDRALGFTCAHISVTDFSSAAMRYKKASSTPADGTVVRLVRGEIAECHSQSESNSHDLGCVNKQVVKSCHMKLVQMNASSTYAGSDRAAQAAFDELKPSVFEAGVDGNWSECDALVLRKATSVGRL